MSETTEEIKMVDVYKLKPHPINSDIYEDIPERDKELMESISRSGIMQPLIITPDYTIVSGVRRWKVAKWLGMSKVPCIIREFDDVELAIIEYNRYRQKTPSELMRELQLLEKKLGARRARKKLSELVGVSEGTIAKLKFIDKHKDQSEEVVDDLMSGKISIDKAYKMVKQRVKVQEVKEVKASPGEQKLFKYYPLSLLMMIPEDLGEEATIKMARKIIGMAIDHLKLEGYDEREILDHAVTSRIPRPRGDADIKLEDVVPEELIQRVGENPKRIKLVLYLALEENQFIFDEAIKKLNFSLG